MRGKALRDRGQHGEIGAGILIADQTRDPARERLLIETCSSSNTRLAVDEAALAIGAPSDMTEVAPGGSPRTEMLRGSEPT
jgi:hypothetical protein